MSRLRRVLEPEVMDTAEEADDYDRMDHAEVNRLFVEDFLEVDGGEQDGARLLLDAGTGPAHIPLLLARRLAGAKIVALDAAREMLRTGARRVAAARQGARIALCRGDAKRLPFAAGAFDSAFSNSIVHHLPDPVPFFAELARVVRPAGTLFVRDLHRPRDEAELERLVAVHAAGAEPRQRRLFRDSLHAAFTVAEVEAMLDAAGIEGCRVARTSDRHWTAERTPP